MSTPLNARSRSNLRGVHPDLVRVVERAAQLSRTPFIVTEGRRTLARQRLLVAQGASKTLRSRHLTGHAIDVAAMAGTKISWALPLYANIADAFREAAASLSIPIRWGGDWNGNGKSTDESFIDGPHFELPRDKYPESTDPLNAKPAKIADKMQVRAERALKYGDRGPLVAKLQTALGVTADGIFGLQTRNAVMLHQATHERFVSGIADYRVLSDLKIKD